tara:strand:- start:154 stop:966 length:813 start_codon:yes stop_codon:yes gene_type:complete
MSITIIIVSYKSDSRIEKCLRNLGSKYNKIIVETSRDKNLKINLEKKFSKTKVILLSNIGYGAAMNFGIKHAKTKYVFMTTPDIILEKNTLKNLLATAYKLNNKFAFLSPATKYYKDKSIIEVETCKGYAIFVEKKQFQKMGGWDEKFFLFYEDHDLCKRFNKIRKKTYIVPASKVKHMTGGFYKSNTATEIEICKNWHFMWSKFYFNKKHNGLMYAYIITFPVFIRSLVKSFFYFFFNKDRFKIYFARFSGLFNAYINKKSWYRPLIKI